MNSYFCEIGNKLSNNIRNTTTQDLQLPPMNEKTIFLHQTNNLEIRNIN